MWIRAGLLAIVLALLTFHAPAQACMYAYPIDLADVRKADAVVIGRISNYTAILDPVIRQTLSEDFPDLSPERLEILRTRPNFVSDYFRFDLQVDEALRGKVDPKICRA